MLSPSRVMAFGTAPSDTCGSPYLSRDSAASAVSRFDVCWWCWVVGSVGAGRWSGGRCARAPSPISIHGYVVETGDMMGDGVIPVARPTRPDHRGHLSRKGGNDDGRPGDPEVEPTPGIAENPQLFDFTLTDEDIAPLDQFDRTGDTERAL